MLGALEHNLYPYFQNSINLLTVLCKQYANVLTQSQPETEAQAALHSMDTWTKEP